MKEGFLSKYGSSGSRAESRQDSAEDAATETEDGLEFEPETPSDAFSLVSADRHRKVMLELRMLDGNSKALAYSYLVAVDFDPSEGIRMDFSGYTVAIHGRNMRPLFDGLVSQRVAVVREMDAIQAEATAAPGAAIVTAIEITPVE
jgi:hypothetical protein